MPCFPSKKFEERQRTLIWAGVTHVFNRGTQFSLLRNLGSRKRCLRNTPPTSISPTTPKLKIKDPRLALVSRTHCEPLDGSPVPGTEGEVAHGV